MACPAGTTRGPSIQPRSIAFLRATSNRRPPVWMNSPRLRTVVKPARRVRRALATARRVRTAGSSCTAVEGAAVVGTTQQEVHLHVHEPREEGQITEVDDDRICRDRRRGDRQDALALDQEIPGGGQFTCDDIEHAGAAQVNVLRRLRAGHHVLLRPGRTDEIGVISKTVHHCQIIRGRISCRLT